ncbi:CDP-diacylglycerol--serine O-phosphatidyltransferase [Parasulfitobacter algicola]|uniref:CDP-diacylglycerol--serine O-phosphatidyltransferase n=1 Tax=Parasulfitobacter algicola TaxID=2614809 RepID=A0ABX2IUL2_9RHOB|nr:CDP-diacylglycerol--serine O-phosphatidyltransferase [Sulfitobacter algicola]NSX56592.1 CDP-diacylglycerol--serine O-phosphatidyltransferase [Sulfitobacter algicola]
MDDKNTKRDGLPLLSLLPNLVTLLGLCAGLTSIRFVMADRFDIAAGLILLAALLDGMDGQLARRLNATSSMGAELDSLSDFLCFGVAPALLLFQLGFQDARGIGWICALVYASCCCLRLARFNVMTDQENLDPELKKNHFVGVPAPAGALLVMLPAFLTFQGVINANDIPIIFSLYMALVGVLMISKLPTISAKSLVIPKNRIALLFIATAVLVGMLLTQFWLSMILISAIYIASLIHSFIKLLQNKNKT